MAGGLGKPDVPRYEGIEDGLAELVPDLVGHLLGEVGPDVVHGEDYAVEVEILVEVTLNQRNGPHELTHALQGVIFALDRDHEAVGGDEGVDGEESQRRGQSMKPMSKSFMASICLRQPRLATHHTGQFHLGAGQVEGGQYPDPPRPTG